MHENRDIQISIDDISMTWIGYRLFTGDILSGIILLGPFYNKRMSEEELIGLIKNMGKKEESLLNNYSLIYYYSCEDYIRIVKMVYFYLYEMEYDERKFGIVGQPNSTDLSEVTDGTINFN